MRQILFAFLISAMPPAPQAGEPPAKVLFGAIAAPLPGDARVIGSYAKGCIAGAIELPETGPTWQAMRLSRNRNWGHPTAIAFIARLGAAARALGWAGIYVGDIAQPRGGPMLTGHASHQLGLDIDIWLRPAHRLDLTMMERETVGSPSVRSPDGRSVTAAWTPTHQALLRAAARDPDVARIFLTPVAKIAMCRAASPGDRDWLRKIRPWWGHDSHFHVRLHCPAGSHDCRPQEPIQEGDGCDATLDWWVSDEALAGPPPTPPRPDLTLADLPEACRIVAEAR
ncbi:MAG TPA: penicillin-insensitive murein endopeptidase [Paracoccaceae bacterium]|nr:penicillin-insensitive murein endopeptidase [Paracoccaceae bacterium]